MTKSVVGGCKKSCSPRGSGNYVAAGTEEGKGGVKVKAQFVVQAVCRLKEIRVMSRSMTCIEYCHNVINFRHVL